MNNNYDTLHKVLIQIVNEGEATIKLGTPESQALIEVLRVYEPFTPEAPFTELLSKLKAIEH